MVLDRQNHKNVHLKLNVNLIIVLKRDPTKKQGADF
jgi:hypothetical protein